MFRRIASYSASLYGVTLVSSAVSFAVTMVIARRISREALGLYGFYVTVYSLVGMLLVSGINQALAKMLGERKTPEGRAAIVHFALGFSALLAAVCLPAAWLLHRGGAWAAGLGIAAVPFFVMNVLAACVYRSAFERKKEVLLRIAVSSINSIVTLGLVFLAFEPERAPIIGDFVSMVLPAVVIGFLLARMYRWRPSASFRSVRSPAALEILRFSIPLAVAGVAFVAYSNASSLLIRALVGLAALGEYYFALQLMLVLEKPMQILSSVVLAAFSQEPWITPEKHRRLVAFNLVLFPTIAAGVVFAAPLLLSLADLVLGGVGGEPLTVKYARAPMFVALFALAVPARCIEFLVSTLAIARGRPDVNRNTHLVTTAVALPTLIALVWWLGVWGAAAMPLVYQTVFLTTQRRQLRTEMPDIVLPATRAAATATVLLAVVLAAGVFVPGAVWFFPLAVLAYLGLGHAFGAFDLRTLVPAKWKARVTPAAENA